MDGDGMMQAKCFSSGGVYVDSAGLAQGLSCLHVQTGHQLKVLYAQTVPQAFVWVQTPPDSDRGEAHTLEHLLLGKGRRAQSVALLDSMSLVRSSAATEQLRTCYHLSAEAGLESFDGPRPEHRAGAGRVGERRSGRQPSGRR